jgi:4-alpha-glucanotransferase
MSEALDQLARPSYPRDVCACVSTHDVPALAGWWLGKVINEQLGLLRAGSTVHHNPYRRPKLAVDLQDIEATH